MSVNWLLYLSHPREVPWPGTVLDIARVCERDNPAAGITGALLFSNELYLQYLEGPCDALGPLWERLARDSRHQIAWKTEGTVPARRLAGLCMGYLDGDRECALLRDEPLWRARERWAPEDADVLIALLMSLARRKYPSSFGG